MFDSNSTVLLSLESLEKGSSASSIMILVAAGYLLEPLIVLEFKSCKFKALKVLEF